MLWKYAWYQESSFSEGSQSYNLQLKISMSNKQNLTQTTKEIIWKLLSIIISINEMLMYTTYGSLFDEKETIVDIGIVNLMHFYLLFLSLYHIRWCGLLLSSIIEWMKVKVLICYCICTLEEWKGLFLQENATFTLFLLTESIKDARLIWLKIHLESK